MNLNISVLHGFGLAGKDDGLQRFPCFHTNNATDRAEKTENENFWAWCRNGLDSGENGLTRWALPVKVSTLHALDPSTTRAPLLPP